MSSSRNGTGRVHNEHEAKTQVRICPGLHVKSALCAVVGAVSSEMNSGLFDVTIVRPTDVRLRRRENVRPLSLRTFACSMLRRRSFAGRTYDHSQR